MQASDKTLLLGTAQWGWTVAKDEAFRLLDAWMAAGYRNVDAATNYPINRNPADFRAAEFILHEYVQAHGIRDLRLTMKIGSLDNLRSPDVNLSPSFIQMMGHEYQRLFGDNLATVMFHWDNRSDATAIHHSLESLLLLCREGGLRPGLSGIAHPAAYAEALRGLNSDFDIQIKHNILQSDLARYAPLTFATGRPHFFAYGINAGGVKLNAPYPAGSTFLARGGQPEQAAPVLDKISAALPDWNTAFVRPPVKTMNQIGLIYAAWHPGLAGLVLGVSSVAQLRESLDFWRNFEVFDYADIYSALKKILLPAQNAV
ncbi:MAG: aldo/keto reductase [Saprospiraceae bacterium]|nr:aldo/keto reductase [Saprospiraceae bacterium]